MILHTSLNRYYYYKFGINLVMRLVFVIVYQLNHYAKSTSVIFQSKNILSSITRHYQGDLYFLKDNIEPNLCKCGSGSFRIGPPKECQCQCLKELPTLRDDTLECVKDIAECRLAEFVNSAQAEKIPYVYIPNKGQLVHPTAEIALLDLNEKENTFVSPVCIITKGQYLTSSGWQDLNNNTFETPFRLFLDSGKTYLQWVGEENEKQKAHGRILLVHLLCRDTAKPKRTLFHPCISFRVVGSTDINKSLLSDTTKVISKEKVLTMEEALTIGIVLGCLVLAYIIVSIIYWKIKKRKKEVNFQDRTKTIEMPATLSNRSQKVGYRLNGKEENKSKDKKFPRTSLVSSEDDSECEDIEDLSKKSNKEKMSITTAVVHDEEIYSTPSEEEEKEGRRQRRERLQMELMNGQQNLDQSQNKNLHHALDSNALTSKADCIGTKFLQEQNEIELVVTDVTDSAQTKKKLYFNPAYFEPENLQAPPPAAVEFLSKIREMISSAKSKMQNKSFQPSLIDIPEDDYSLRASRTPSTLSNVKTSSRTTCEVDDLEEKSKIVEEEPIYSDITDEINSEITEKQIKKGINTTMKDKKKSDATDPGCKSTNTLKRLAQRVNSHGQTLVSEIIKTLELKPRFPDCSSNSFLTAKNVSNSLSFPNKEHPNNIVNSSKGSTDFPDLVKPSMLKNNLALLNDKNQDLDSSFENFRQEIKETLNKVKPVSPIGSLDRDENLIKTDQSIEITEPTESKVHKWLQSLDVKSNPYFKIYESVNSKQNNTNIKGKNNTQHREIVRSGSLNQVKTTSIEGSLAISKGSITSLQNIYTQDQTSIIRFQSCHGESINKKINSSMDENKNYTNNPTSKFINYDVSKVPNCDPSDSESDGSDYPSRFIDSLEYNVNNPLPMHSIYASNKNTLMKQKPSLSILEETNMNTHGTGMFGNPFHSDHENSYEEIQLKNGYCTSTLQNSPNIVNSQIEIKTPEIKIKSQTKAMGCKEIDDDDTKCSIYSNPDSLVSEIHISADKPIGMQSSGNRLSIEVNDSMSSESDINEDKQNVSIKKKKNKLKRNDSILQDSLERPKLKKKLSNAERKLSFKRKDKSSSTNILIKENQKGDMTINNLSGCTDVNDDVMKVRRSKTMRTFKDYHLMKFLRNNNSSNNQLSIFGEGINLNYKSATPSKPPLPPKQLKSNDDNPLLNCSQLKNLVPTIPPKHKLKYSASLSLDLDRKPKLSLGSEEEIPKLPPKTKLKKSNLDLKTMEHNFPTHINNSSHQSDPPKLPEKYRQKDRILAKEDNVLELTKSHLIHNGVQTHLSNNENSNCVKQNFQKGGNIVNDILEFNNNVPTKKNYLVSEEQSEFCIKNVENSSKALNKVNMLTKEMTDEIKFKRELAKTDNVNEILHSERNILRDQFILSNNKSLALQRQNTSKREKDNDRFQDSKNIQSSNDPIMDNIDKKLEIKLRSEVERHYKENNDSDTIKKNWRKVLENVNASKEREKVIIQDMHKYISSLQSNSKDYHSNTE